MSNKNISGKNCLLVFKNKKINEYDSSLKLIKQFSESGYSFDKVSFISFNDSEEIVRAIVDGKDNYENIIVYCPKTMEKTLKKFFKSLYKVDFDETNILKAENCCVFLVFSDAENCLKLDEIKAFLDRKYGRKYERTYIKLVGVSPAKIEAAIKQVKSISGEVEYNVTNIYGECTIEILYSDTTAKMVIDEIVRKILENLNEYVYALENISLAQQLYKLLKLRRMKICVAESFTGGGISKRLVEVSGISEVYFEGLNTYSNLSKISRLGVNEYNLNRYGAVSKETAKAMAQGLLDTGNCDICISTTGIAGPNSDNTSKPVGLLFIGIGTSEGVNVYKFNLKGGRKDITETAINLALFLAYKSIK